MIMNLNQLKEPTCLQSYLDQNLQIQFDLVISKSIGSLSTTKVAGVKVNAMICPDLKGDN